MFSYYGSKSKLAHMYPKPTTGRIIEPFAGSARYSLLHFEKNVLLADLSEHVFAVWDYLIQASEKDVRSLPDVPSKIHIENYTQLSDPEKYLIGFHLCRGTAKPRKVGHGQNSWSRDRERIASQLYKIRHWQIVRSSYRDIANTEATWFIDPPYVGASSRPGNSDRYQHWKIDYEDLADFCNSRLGQVIVCEGEKADWLPFRFLAHTNANTNSSSVKVNSEFIFSRTQQEVAA
jgi:site-specific DNA-adenine methylase